MRHLNHLKLILLLAVVLRVAAALYLGNEVVSLPGTDDQVSYHNLALRVLGGHGFSFDRPWWPATAAEAPTAHWSYPYTLYLVAVYFIFGPYPLIARLIQAVAVGLLHPYLVYRITGEICQSFQPQGRSAVSERPTAWSSVCSGALERAPLLAAGITAIYIYFIYYAAALMSEPFYICAVLASLWLAIVLGKHVTVGHSWKRVINVSLVLGVAVLFRQLFLLFIPFLFLWLAMARREVGLRRNLAAIGTIMLLIGLMILPFTIYNYIRFDRFVLLNTNAGYAFYLANHPAYGSRFRSALEMGDTYRDLIPDDLRHLNEAALDQALLIKGLNFVLEDPMRYASLTLSRIGYYFKFWFDPDSSTLSNVSRIGSFGIFLPFMLYGLLRPLVDFSRSGDRRRILASPPAPVVLLYLFCLVYTAIHLLSWAQIRYRLPVDGVLVVFAGIAMAELCNAFLRLRPFRLRA
ncbi:MAG TPA: hypothetical protein PLP42_05960 [Acidobacteriota bacterium]|nr:hypothetical protein [Acidobacteriota bacterium]